MLRDIDAGEDKFGAGEDELDAEDEFDVEDRFDVGEDDIDAGGDKVDTGVAGGERCD